MNFLFHKEFEWVAFAIPCSKFRMWIISEATTANDAMAFVVLLFQNNRSVSNDGDDDDKWRYDWETAHLTDPTD